jgi:hypothetical protein
LWALRRGLAFDSQFCIARHPSERFFNSLLRKLETLSLATLPSWDASRRRIQVQSLEPLAKLPALRAIELFGVVNPDRTLAALATNRTIKTARFAGYPTSLCENPLTPRLTDP